MTASRVAVLTTLLAAALACAKASAEPVILVRMPHQVAKYPDGLSLRPKLEAELKFGQDYQKAYQAHEARQIAAGVALDDPSFYRGFLASQGSVATPSGPEEWVAVRAESYNSELRRKFVGFVVAAAGLAIGAYLTLAARRHYRAGSARAGSARAG